MYIFVHEDFELFFNAASVSAVVVQRSFRCATRSISRTVALRPVSGLASLDLSPSHDCSQWHDDKPTLAYRCGGSTGIGF